MTKLPKQHQFIDLSDYGRPVAVWIAKGVLNTNITPIHITLAFVISGSIAIICILNEWFWAAAFFLILKSILDAADGTLARLRNKPSYVGRYFDSISDIILNFFILLSIWQLVDVPFIYMLLAFVGIQLQGTLYNYYYVIIRNKHDGDNTSRIFETKAPKAMPGERQKQVNFFFKVYIVLYGGFDQIIYFLDRKAVHNNFFPNWFMTFLSTFGLGFQLLLIGALLVCNQIALIIPFFIAYTSLIIVFIGIRILLNKGSKEVAFKVK
jgi:phosphatidylglycerophosphate synthase